MGFPLTESTCSFSLNTKQCKWKSASRTAPFGTDHLRLLVNPTSLQKMPRPQPALGTRHHQAPILLQDLTKGQQVWVEAKKTQPKSYQQML